MTKKEILLEEILKKPPRFSIASAVSMTLADRVINGYVDVDDYSNPLGEKFVQTAVFPPIIMPKKEYAQKREYFDRSDYMEETYNNIKYNAERKLFVYMCRHIIDFYNGYENTPIWFRNAIQNIGI
jgi:hypothetical protein